MSKILPILKLGSLMIAFATAQLASSTALANGFVIVTGDDADDSGHCQGTNCGGLYPNLFRQAVASGQQALGTNVILAVGANASEARFAFDSWNNPANGGPGSPVVHVGTAEEIAAVDFSEFAMVYVSSIFGHTPGGIGPDLQGAQVLALNMRQADIATYVNDLNGSLIALTQANVPAPHGWGFLPAPLTTEDRQFTDATPTAELGVLSPTTTQANLSHCCFHNVFTGPQGYSGLRVLAVQAGTNDPVMLGGANTILTAEICDNGVDDDDDDAIDLEDTDCQYCGNGVIDADQMPAEECDDGNNNDGDGCSAACTLDNEAPVAQCQDQMLVVSNTCGVCGSVDDGSYDPEGFVSELTQSQDCFELGATEVTLTIVDNLGQSDSCTATVTVIDDTPPEIIEKIIVTQWPPNHRVETFRLSDCVSEVIDNCSEASLDVDTFGRILSIYSDEPNNSVGDGNTSDDIVIVSDSTFQVVVERQGTSDGRVYGVTYEVVDLNGNSLEGMCYVDVRHNPKRTAVDSGASAGFTVTNE